MFSFLATAQLLPFIEHWKYTRKHIERSNGGNIEREKSLFICHFDVASRLKMLFTFFSFRFFFLRSNKSHSSVVSKSIPIVAKSTSRPTQTNRRILSQSSAASLLMTVNIPEQNVANEPDGDDSTVITELLSNLRNLWVACNRCAATTHNNQKKRVLKFPFVAFDNFTLVSTAIHSKCRSKNVPKPARNEFYDVSAIFVAQQRQFSTFSFEKLCFALHLFEMEKAPLVPNGNYFVSLMFLLVCVCKCASVKSSTTNKSKQNARRWLMES